MSRHAPRCEWSGLGHHVQIRAQCQVSTGVSEEVFIPTTATTTNTRIHIHAPMQTHTHSHKQTKGI